MIVLLFASLLNLVHADPSWKWSNSVGVSERHEFYKNSEILTKPQNSWQTLFAIVYKNGNLKTLKDCVFYRVPGLEFGILKIKTIKENEKCETHLYKSGDQEWPNLKALQFSIQPKSLSISLTNQKFEVERWETPLFNLFKAPVPKLHISSAEYRSPKMIFLQPYKGVMEVKPLRSQTPRSNGICHDISTDCKEKSPSVCSQCDKGWFEIPNGCAQSPKFCGVRACGLKNRPACPRGRSYQKAAQEYDCRVDKSFAYCSKGLRVECQGNLAYCL